MEKTKNIIWLLGVGVSVGLIVGMVVTLILLSAGAIPTEFTVAGIVRFTMTTPIPTVVVVVVTPTSTPTPIPTFVPTSTPLPPSWTGIKTVIDVETTATANRDLESVLSLYADNAVVIEPSTGTWWNGKDEIRSRYSDIFARHRFLENIHQLTDLKLEPPDNPTTATAKVRQRATIQDVTDGSVTRGAWTQEYWFFARIDNTWKITRFIYGMPD